MTMIHNKNDILFSALLVAVLSCSVVFTPSHTSVTEPSAEEKQELSATQSILPKSVVAATTPSNQVLPKPLVTDLPDFAAMTNVRQKKQAFFDYLLPKVRQANAAIIRDRQKLLQIRNDIASGTSIDQSALDLIGGLSKRYRVEPHHDSMAQVNALLIKVDVVPESLVLAQAANESGWGTSRFARQANNLFGVWCFRRGCGLTPRYRDEGLTHEVARYESVQDSVRAYMHTINTNPAYEDLRFIRRSARLEQLQLATGHALAEGLLKYSARGEDYVREIQQLIRVNNLQQYTLPVKV